MRGPCQDTREQLTKLQDRSSPMVYLGVEPGLKANRCYDPTSEKIVVSRDVIFEEDRRWDWQIGEQESPFETTNPKNFLEPDVGVEQEAFRPDSHYNGKDANLDSSPHQDFNKFYGFWDDTSKGAEPQEPESSQGKLPPRHTYDDPPVRGFRSLEDVYAQSEVTQQVPIQRLLLLLTNEKLVNFYEAQKDERWQQAMADEIQCIEQNHTWKLVNLPPDKRSIGLKWVFKLKKDAMGNVTRHKARLVAKGYVQKLGIDYNEVFPPITRLETVRLLALAARKGWQIHHLDIKTAFLNGELLEEVYVTQPQGLEQHGKEHMVYKLRKALYGLKQAPRAWNTKLHTTLIKLGFCRFLAEHAVYKRSHDTGVLLLGVYVDDLIITGSSLHEIERFK